MTKITRINSKIIKAWLISKNIMVKKLTQRNGGNIKMKYLKSFHKVISMNQLITKAKTRFHTLTLIKFKAEIIQKSNPLFNRSIVLMKRIIKMIFLDQIKRIKVWLTFRIILEKI